MTRLQWSGQPISIVPGASALACLEAAGVGPSSSCRSGACQSCLVRVVEGDIPASAQVGLSPGQKARGLVLACVCSTEQPLSLSPVGAEDAPVPATLVGKSIRGAVLLVDVLVPGFVCQGGQFVHLVRPDGLTRPYSVAHRNGDVLRLHVEVVPNGQMSGWLAEAPLGIELRVRGPAGACVYVDEPDRPLMLAGLGTGLAPLLGILADATAAGHQAPVHLHVGARTASQLYFADELRALAESTPRLVLHLGALDAQGVAGVRAGPLDDGVLSDSEVVQKGRHYVCGAPDWVRGLQRRLFLAGASLSRIHADAFVTAVA